jgi:hypothetical protein
MMAVEELLSFIWRHWKLFVGGAVVAVFAVLLLIAKGDARHFKKLYEQQVELTASAESKLAVSNASINTLTTALNDKNAESEARARAYSDTKAADAQTIATMDARAKADASRLDTLRRLSRDLPDNPVCRVPAALAANLEGL